MLRVAAYTCTVHVYTGISLGSHSSRLTRSGLELLGVWLEPPPPVHVYRRSYLSDWKSALNFNPCAKFQIFRHLTPPPVLLGQFLHCRRSSPTDLFGRRQWADGAVLLPCALEISRLTYLLTYAKWAGNNWMSKCLKFGTAVEIWNRFSPKIERLCDANWGGGGEPSNTPPPHHHHHHHRQFPHSLR